MNARDEIAYLLWTAMPSSDDAEAKATAEQLLNAYRTQVLNEAAEILRARAAQYPTRRIFAAGLRHGALALAKAAMGRGKSSPSGADATSECGGRS